MNTLDRSLDELLTSTPDGPGRYRFDVPDGWQQGRGAFGGLVVGAMVRAAQRDEGDDTRRVRSVTAEIPAPVMPGEATLEVSALRRGNNVSTVRVTLVQRDEPAAQCVVVLGARRPIDARWVELAPPPAADWRATDPLPFIEGVVPAFARAFEFRVTGFPPFAGGDTARAEGWVRPRTPCATRDAGWVAALADAFWPTILARAEGPRPAATVAFTLQLVADPATIPDDEPLRYRAAGPVLDEGYAVELRELWTADGRLVALNQQTFVVMR